MTKDYLGKDQRRTRDEPKEEEKEIRGIFLIKLTIK